MSHHSFQNYLQNYLDKGWVLFPKDQRLTPWIDRAAQLASDALSTPENAQWYRCAGTWFVGVNALANNDSGHLKAPPESVQKTPIWIPFQCEAKTFAENLAKGKIIWDRAQVSVCFPGYPLKSEEESQASYSFRFFRDAAHVDGLLPIGSGRRRYLREHHSFILGIPLDPIHSCNAPLVIYEGSHKLVQLAFRHFFSKHSLDEWHNLDITDLYHQVRNTCLDQCKKVEMTAKPGEVYILHRHSVHGIKAWDISDKGKDILDPRTICYFRPEFQNSELWISEP